ncbi:putative anthocyanidin reductase isoform X2 [Euphorbia lathyris]|uniref:putative anthocyanidin reductase isoform X2 n=1 Tax=Euphorbia lathyris TaxID=212925 RepID=UPI003314320C
MVILFLYIIKLKEESCLFLFPQKKKKKKMEKYGNGEQVYCVTGANGYIGSCLVKLLLQNGYTVHATIRNPEKWSQLLSLWDGGKKLRVFKADLEEEGSFDEAVKGCHGVFHVAASMEFSTIDNPDFEYVESKIIEPAKKGTLNLMKSCSKYKVKKVVFTSSISTLTAKDTSGKWRKVVDETCQNPIAHVLNAKPKPSGWVYVVSKLVTEEAALDYGKQNGIDVVSVITTTVGGSFLTSSVPASIQVILSPLTGDSKYLSILAAVNSRMGSIALVHIEDICNVHLFLMNHPQAHGRFICSSGSCLITDLLNHLKQHYPISNPNPIHRYATGGLNSIPCEISSKRLKDLGFKYKHDINHIIHQTIACSLDYGFLSSSPLN